MTATLPSPAEIDLGIDLVDTFDPDKALSLTAAAAMIPATRKEGPVHSELLRRWALAGYRAWAGGPVVRLPHLRISGQILTMPDWVRAFQRKRVELGVRKAEPPAAEAAELSRPPAKREREQARATAELRKELAKRKGGRR